MKIFKSRSMGILVLVLCILAGTLIGAHRPLAKMAREASAVFYEGEDKDGLGIRNDLEERCSIAYNLTVVAARNLEPDDAVITAVRDARNAVLEAETPAAMYRADRKLDETVTNLYNTLNNMTLPDKDARYTPQLYADFIARADMISRSSYNRVAEECNAKLAAFPANILSKLVFISPVELYR